MQAVLGTLFFEHDLRLVGLAALICAISAYAAVTMLSHAANNAGRTRNIWLSIAAIATGFGIWSTHFIAMSAFNPGMDMGYTLGMTVLSLAVAIGVTGFGFWIAVSGGRKSDRLLGGAITGLGISGMHFIGMASLIVGGSIVWRSDLIAASIILGALLGAAALYAGLKTCQAKCKIAGMVFLTLAICTMHFTAMGAAGFQNCYAIITEVDGVASLIVPVSVAVASLLMLLAALLGVQLELRERMRSEREFGRLQGLANAAVEGLVVCDGATIVTVNDSFAKLLGGESAALVGKAVTDFVNPDTFDGLLASQNDSIETELKTIAGELLPVEIIVRQIDFGGKQHNALAVRDLRASRKADQHIRYLAQHDSLTGLANRAHFSEKLVKGLDDAIRHKTRLALLCLDVDRFKELNELVGYNAGDQVLQRVAECLSNLSHPGKFASRLSGDEFALVLEDLASPDDAGRMATEILKALDSLVIGGAEGHKITASIGIALFPENAEDSKTLANGAETALHRAKQTGRGTYCYFEDEMGAEVRERRLLEQDLRTAIANDELSLVYQPQVRLADSSLIGFEALLRWHHPERGTISPGIFIPLAEETGLILPIGEWVLKTACEEAARWTNPLGVAVNVSTVQLHNGNFPKTVQKLLRDTGLSPSRLELEVTETALVKDMPTAIATLAQIKALGVRIAMDDFGTGYSSLSNLRAFAFDKIKVDQSFIKTVDHSEQSATIVRAVLGLGQGLNLPVLAEGVERVQELDFLRAEHCAEAQGYLFGRPTAIDAFKSFTHGDQTIMPQGRDWNAERKTGSVVSFKKRGKAAAL